MKHLLLITVLFFTLSCSVVVENFDKRITIPLKLPTITFEQQDTLPVGKTTLNEELSLYQKERDCMIEALYFEGRGESERGIALIGQVILNRVESKSFPDTICGVVKQKRGEVYQFSYLSQKNLEMKDLKALEKVTRIASKVLDGHYQHLTRTKFYKRCDKKSSFFDTLEYRGREQSHCFYQVASK